MPRGVHDFDPRGWAMTPPAATRSGDRMASDSSPNIELGLNGGSPEHQRFQLLGRQGVRSVGSRTVPVRAALMELPTGLLIGMTVVTASVMALGVLGDAPLHVAIVAPALCALFLITTIVSTWWLSDRSGRAVGWAGFIPAGWVLFVGLLSVFRDGADRVEWFLGGDNVRHLGEVISVVGSGRLDYSENAYPRAWHDAISVLWLVDHQVVDEQSVRSFIELNAAATWLLFACLVLATSNLASSLAQRLAPNTERLESCAALVAGFTALTPRFMADTMALGFQTSLLASVILVVAARECVVARRSQLGNVAVFLGLIVLMSHAWQLLIPAVTLPAIMVCWPIVRADIRTRTLALFMVAVAALAAVPPIRSVFLGPGVGATAAEGVVMPPMWLVLLAAALGSVAILIRRPSAHTLAAVATLATPTLSAIAITIAAGVSLTAYYPAKLLWNTAEMSLSFLAVVAVIVALRAVEAGPPLSLGGVVIGVLIAGGVALGAASPFGAQVGAWSTVDGGHVLETVTLPGASEAQGVWMETSTESAVTRTLLAQLGGQQLSRDRLTLAEECAALKASTQPTVVTTHSRASTLRRYDCVKPLVILSSSTN